MITVEPNYHRINKILDLNWTSAHSFHIPPSHPGHSDTPWLLTQVMGLNVFALNTTATERAWIECTVIKFHLYGEYSVPRWKTQSRCTGVEKKMWNEVQKGIAFHLQRAGNVWCYKLVQSRGLHFYELDAGFIFRSSKLDILITSGWEGHSLCLCLSVSPLQWAHYVEEGG